MITRVLCADDSKHVLNILCRLLSSDEEIVVVGKARDGREVIDMARELDPDVITLDLKMPGMDGLEALKVLKAQTSIPVIVVSSYTQYGAKTTLEALDLGAADFVPKPASGRSDDLLKLKDELIQMVKEVSGSSKKWIEGAESGKLNIIKGIEDGGMEISMGEGPIELGSLGIDIFGMIAMGCSTGGPMAVKKILSLLPSSFPWPVVIVQHMPLYFTEFYAEKLDSGCKLHVKEAENEEEVAGGNVYIAPGDRHIMLKETSGGLVFSIDSSPPITGARPSIDLFMKSVSSILGKKAVGVLLSGMGSDGVDGLLKLKQAGAITIAQDRRSSIVYGMPGKAINSGAATYVVELERIPDFIYVAAKKRISKGV
jgi:two-component system chemotaxis response regulator CheB